MSSQGVNPPRASISRRPAEWRNHAHARAPGLGGQLGFLRLRGNESPGRVTRRRRRSSEVDLPMTFAARRTPPYAATSRTDAPPAPRIAPGDRVLEARYIPLLPVTPSSLGRPNQPCLPRDPTPGAAGPRARGCRAARGASADPGRVGTPVGLPSGPRKVQSGVRRDGRSKWTNCG